MRKEVVTNLIKKTPGVSYNEIVRETGLSNGVISHYLIKLMESGEVEKEGIKRGKYFLKNIPKKDRKMITLLRNNTNNDIFKLLMKNLNNNKIGALARRFVFFSPKIAPNVPNIPTIRRKHHWRRVL